MDGILAAGSAIRMMRIVLGIAVLLMLAAIPLAAEVVPNDPATPLFRIFEPIPVKASAAADTTRVTYDDKHPLMIVHSVADLRLARDEKGVLLTLTASDTKTFATITRQHNGHRLLLVAEGDVVQAMNITGPIVDGVLGFKFPESAPVAEYLRRRFHLAEFK